MAAPKGGDYAGVVFPAGYFEELKKKTRKKKPKKKKGK